MAFSESDDWKPRPNRWLVTVEDHLGHRALSVIVRRESLLTAAPLTSRTGTGGFEPAVFAQG
jgi:hypothetical protein